MIRSLDVLQISPADRGGGAEWIAAQLHEGLRARGVQAWLAVGRKLGDSPGVLEIDHAGAALHAARPFLRAAAALRRRDAWRAARLVELPGAAGRAVDDLLGRETFRFPGTRRLLDLPPRRPAVLHLHNLHGRYFDLSALPELSAAVPTVTSLHDAWLLAGHCAHSLDCERWRSGCGSCPHLGVYPALLRDGTAGNWRRKRDIYTRSGLHVVTPSRWLMERVERSILAPAVRGAYIVPYGVDLETFTPRDRWTARHALGVADGEHLAVTTANGLLRNDWKDYATLRAAIEELGRRDGPPLVVFALGEDAPTERIGRATLRFVAPVREPRCVAEYLVAADVYVHAARADTFPNAVLEALACGTPVVASRVGGIPDQVLPLGESDRPTGLLVPPGDPRALAEALSTVMEDTGLRSRLAAAAAADGRTRFDVRRMVDDYLAIYESLAGHRPGPAAATHDS